jgi:hypothetical protein
VNSRSNSHDAAVRAGGLPAGRLSGSRRRSSDRTQAVHSYALDLAASLLAYEVRLETLLLGDTQRARFRTDELGPLGADDSFARRLRETLLAWLTIGSHGSAAAMLGVCRRSLICRRLSVRFSVHLGGMKLSQWAAQEGIHYQTAWRWFKDGTLPVTARQLATGTDSGRGAGDDSGERCGAVREGVVV